MRKVLFLVFLVCATNCVSCQNEREKIMKEASMELVRLWSDGTTDLQKMNKCEVYNDSTLKFSAFLDLEELLGRELDGSMKDMVIAALKAQKPTFIQLIKEIKSFKKLKEYKTYLIFSFYDLKRNHWGDITISPEEYSNEKLSIGKAKLSAEDEKLIIDIMKEDVKETNKILPVTMEDGRVLFSYDFWEDTKTVEFAYRMPKDLLIWLKEEADISNTLLEVLLKQAHVEEIQQGANGTFALLKTMFIYKYKYYDENKKLLYTIIVDKNDF